MIGFNDMGMFTTDFSAVKLRDKIGLEVESLDMLQLLRRMEALEAGEVNKEIQRVTRAWEYPLGKPKQEVLERVFRMYLATVQICREKNFSGFSYKCVDGVDAELGLTHAVPSALVASAGIPYVDENDVGNLVAELMLKWLTGQEPMFLEHYDHHPEWILLGEDGYIPDAFIDGKPQIKNVSTVLLGGIAHCSRLKLGRMTLACLAEDARGLPDAHRERGGAHAPAVGGDGRAAALLAQREVLHRRAGAPDPGPRAVPALRRRAGGLRGGAEGPLLPAGHQAHPGRAGIARERTLSYAPPACCQWRRSLAWSRIAPARKRLQEPR